MNQYAEDDIIDLNKIKLGGPVVEDTPRYNTHEPRPKEGVQRTPANAPPTKRKRATSKQRPAPKRNTRSVARNNEEYEGTRGWSRTYTVESLQL